MPGASSGTAATVEWVNCYDNRCRVVQGHKILLLLDDLNDYISSQTPLQEFAERLDHHAESWVVAAACSNGPERAVIKAAEGTSLGRFYRERIYSEFELLPLSAGQKEQLAHSIGEEWDQEQSEWYPTPGAITTEEPTRAMRQRFEHALNPEQKDVLRALLLLAFAGVQPYTHSRLSAILADERLFDRTDLHLRDCLTFLAEQAFISRPGPQDPVYPESAYLRDTVSYIEDRLPMQDFPILAAALEKAEDTEGLNLLGLTWGWHLNNYEQAIACFDRAISTEPDFIPALGNKGWALGRLERHDEALEFFDKVSDLDSNDLIARYNQAAALNRLERYTEALEIIDQLIELWPDYLSENPDVWTVKAFALKGLERWEEVLEPCERALDLRPEDPKLWNDYGMLLAQFEERREEALDAADKSITRGLSEPTAWELKAILLADVERHEEALDTIDQAISRWPDNADTWVIKGIILIQAERHEEAANWLCRAWRERERLRDKGTYAEELLKEIECDPEECG